MDKILANIIKQTTAFKIFDRDIENAFCHAYMIIGTDTLALESLLELVVARVYCKDVCLNCAECKKVFENNKPDANFLNVDGENITVDQVTAMVEDSYLSAVEGGEKLYIIKNFNKQSPVIQNKLLKTLEEPPASVHILLSATSTQGILPTVLSRVKQVSLSTFSTAQIEKWLSSEGSADCKEIAKAANGSLTLAQKLACDTAFLDDSATLVKIYNQINGSVSIPKAISNKIFENLANVLNLTEVIFQDVLYVKCDLSQNITFIHLLDEYITLANSLTITGISNIMSEIITSQQKLNVYVQKINIVDCFLLKIAEEKSKCKKLSV